MAYTENDPESYLHSYLQMHLKEEVQLEGLTRNIEAFSRFLEAASFSQAQYLNISQVAADCHVERKSVTQYFSILETRVRGSILILTQEIFISTRNNLTKLVRPILCDKPQPIF